MINLPNPFRRSVTKEISSTEANLASNKKGYVKTYSKAVDYMKKSREEAIGVRESLLADNTALETHIKNLQKEIESNKEEISQLDSFIDSTDPFVKG